MPRRMNDITRIKSLSRLGRMRNIPSVLSVLPSAMFWGWSSFRSKSMHKLSSPLLKLQDWTSKKARKERPSVRKSKRTTWKWRGRRTRKAFARSVGQGHENWLLEFWNGLDGGQRNDCEYHSST